MALDYSAVHAANRRRRLDEEKAAKFADEQWAKQQKDARYANANPWKAAMTGATIGAMFGGPVGAAWGGAIGGLGGLVGGGLMHESQGGDWKDVFSGRSLGGGLMDPSVQQGMVTAAANARQYEQSNSGNQATDQTHGEGPSGGSLSPGTLPNPANNFSGPITNTGSIYDPDELQLENSDLGSRYRSIYGR
jgi:hypothetical protein